LDSRLEALYASCPTLRQDYVREVLGLSGDQAEKVDRITGGIHRDEADLVARITDDVDPKVSIEVGLGYGFSALTICASGHRPKSERRHIIFDPHQTSYWAGRGLQHLIDAGFGSIVELHEEPSYRGLTRLEIEGVRADLAFVDGWHTFDYVLVDFFLIDKMLRPQGVVMFDDADWPSVRPVVRFAVSNLGYEVVGTLPEKRPRESIDIDLGIEGSCIALKKPVAERKREIFYHQPFM
jgi:predicted O-methyltransferase YrrM